MQDVLSLASGSLVGFVLGLIGGGGSIIAMPLLLYIVGVGSPHVAIGTSAISVSLSAASNLVGHIRKGTVKWPCAITFSAAGVIGAWAGSSLAMRLPGSQLMALFGAVMIIVGIGMALRRNVAGNPDIRLNFSTLRQLLPMLLIVGFFVGALSGFFGIGGGFLIVPGLMLATGMPLIYAIGTSLVAVAIFGLTTASNYAFAGLVDWRVAAWFIGGGILGGLAGSKMSQRLKKTRMLNVIFADAVMLVGLYIVAREIWGTTT